MGRGSPRVQYDRVYNVVPGGATLERWLEICRAAYQTKQTVGFSWDDACIGDLDNRVVTAWDVTENRPAFQGFVNQYYPGVKLNWAGAGPVTPTPTPNPNPNPTPTPIPPKPGSNVIGRHPALPALPLHKRMGVHMLNWGRPEIDTYTAAGCQSFTLLDNILAAREVRAAGFAAIVRKWIDGAAPPGEAHLLSMGIGRTDKFMVMFINENDSIPAEDIERRFAAEKPFVEAVWRHFPECFPLMGSFSMGTPSIENPEKARVWRNTYGAFLNANRERVGLNYHCYSARSYLSYKPAAMDVIHPHWLEMRWLEIGYDPLYGGLHPDVVIVGDESGKDIGSYGGFLGIGDTEEDVRIWAADRMALFAAYPQMYVHNLFQGNWANPRWASYNIRPHLGPLSDVWAGRVAPKRAPGALTRAVREAVSPLGDNWSPPRKMLYAL